MCKLFADSNAAMSAMAEWIHNTLVPEVKNLAEMIN
jgi:hypothetical protein